MDLKYLLKYKIDKHLTHGLGFSTENQKWYGWSHRALFGFGIGSTVKKGDSGYKPMNQSDMGEQMTDFWFDPDPEAAEEYGYIKEFIEVKYNTIGPGHYESVPEEGCDNELSKRSKDHC